MILLLTLILACAKEGFPPGGPEDKTPPEVVASEPLSGATNVDPAVTVQVWFSEGVQAASAKDAVFITPYPGDDVKIRWKGRRCTIQFSEPMKPNQTMVVTFGTGIKDFRNNAMTSSFTLAFSTGPFLDEGRITGRIEGLDDARGVDVWAFVLSDSSDVDPSAVQPDYVVQTAEDGGFAFTYLAPGQYRLFAVRDRMADRFYQAGEDEIGVTFRDAMLYAEGFNVADSLWFRITREDTLGPSLVRTLSPHTDRVQLDFDEPLSAESVQNTEIVITEVEDSTRSLSVLRSALDPLQPHRVHVSTDLQASGRMYHILVRGIEDIFGNPADSAFASAEFPAAVSADTSGPELQLAEPEPGMLSAPLGGRIRLVFSEDVDSALFASGFTLSDSLGHPIAGDFVWFGLSDIVFQPNPKLESKHAYSVHLTGDSICDMKGNRSIDSTYTFQTMNGDTLSEIAGEVIDPDSAGRGAVYVSARQIDKSGQIVTQRITGPGPYRFTDVLPGAYILECFRDRNGDGLYSFGKSYPFEPAERFSVYADTVKVRSRWPNEGNNLVLPKR